MLSLDRWEVGVQPMYFLDTPIVAGPGSALTVSCAYDTTSRTSPTYWGGRIDEDEMCFAHVYLTR